jgi:maleylacetate reductase
VGIALEAGVSLIVLPHFEEEAEGVHIQFGTDAGTGVVAELGRFGRTHPLVIASNRHADLVAELEANSDLVVSRFTTVRRHVPTALVEQALTEAARSEIDSLVCIGGGSSIGLGKALAHQLALPIVAVPTTYSGSEMTPVWGVTDGRVKRTATDPLVRPAAVIYDHRLTTSLPVAASGASGLNALAHCVAVGSGGAGPLGILTGLEGIAVLMRALPLLAQSPSDACTRSGLQYGGFMAGLTLSRATMGLHHRLCHLLGGAFDLPHADTHAALLPYSIEAARLYRHPLGQRVAAAIGSDNPAGRVWDIGRQLGLPTSLSDLGVTARAVDKLLPRLATEPSDRSVVEARRAVIAAALSGDRPERRSAA